MVTTPYEDALHAIERLTSEERQRLQEVLGDLQTSNTTGAYPGQPTGAALVAVLDAQPSDPVIWEKIERIIKDECERVDTDTW